MPFQHVAGLAEHRCVGYADERHLRSHGPNLEKVGLTHMGLQKEQGLSLKIPLTDLGGLGCLAESDVGLQFNSLLNARPYDRYILLKNLIKQEHTPDN